MMPNNKTELQNILKLLSQVSIEDKIKFRDYLKALSSETVQKGAITNG